MSDMGFGHHARRLVGISSRTKFSDFSYSVRRIIPFTAVQTHVLCCRGSKLRFTLTVYNYGLR